MLRLAAAFRCAQPIPGGTRGGYPLPAHTCSVRAAEWVERSETRNDWDRRTALGMRLLSVPLCAAHRSNIREWYCDHAPRPNTWPLNIAPLDQFHLRRDFRSGRSTSRTSVARRPHTAG